MSKKIKNEQKKFLGETLNQYDKALNEGIAQLDKKNREQNHKISSLVNSFDNEYLEKDVEGNMTTLENSKDGMVIINEIQGSTEVNYCKDGEKELILNGDIDTQGESFVTITEGVDGGLVDVSLEGNTEINLSKTKDPVLVTREFDDINCNTGKLQYTIDDVTTINDEPGKVDIDRIVGDTMVNHAVNGSEELILNAHIDKSGDNNITLNGVTSDGGKVDVALEGNTLVNVSNVKDDYITPTIEDKVDQGSVISLPEVSEGLIHIDELQGNTLVNYCTDGSKEMTLNGDIDVEGVSVTTTEGVDNGKVDVMCEGNTLVNLSNTNRYAISKAISDTNLVITSDTNYLKATTNGEIYNNSWVYANFGKPKLSLLKPNTKYTVIGDVIKGIGTMAICEGSTANALTPFSSVKNNRVLLTTNNLTSEIDGQILYGWIKNNEENKPIDIEVKNLIILEGDWLDKEVPQYFEGMKSVGQDDVNGHKIEILSHNGNLYKRLENSHYRVYGSTVTIIEENENGFIYKAEGWDMGLSYLISTEGLFKNKKYRLSWEANNNTPSTPILHSDGIKLLNSNKSFKEIISWDRPSTFEYDFKLPDSFEQGDILEIRFKNSALSVENGACNICINEIGVAKNTVISKLNKKEILINEPLRGLPNGVKDRFVKIGGKWFIERNCSEEIFDGSEDEWWKKCPDTNWETDTHIAFRTTIPSMIINNWSSSSVAILDKFKTIKASGSNYGNSDEFSSTDGGMLNIKILKSKLVTQNVEGFKQWLQTNPVKAIYQLATPTYEPLEIEPTLNTYNDVTHISNNSIVPCTMKIKNTGYNAIIKPSTLYTVALDTNKSGTIGMNLGGMKTVTTNNVATITTPAILSDDSLRLFGKGIKGSKVRLLEGDKTNWIPSYFEGMKSSFEDKVQGDGSYKMEILMNNKNLLDVEENLTFDRKTILINLKKGKYIVSYKSISGHLNGRDSVMAFYNGDKEICHFTITNGKTFDLNFDCDRVHLYSNGYNWVDSQDLFVTVNTLQLAKGNVVLDAELQKSNKIQFSSIEPLRKTRDAWDKFVFIDGKLMIERNCIEFVFDGSEDEGWGNSYQRFNKYYVMRCIPSVKIKSSWDYRSRIKSSHFPSIGAYIYAEPDMDKYIKGISSDDNNVIMVGVPNYMFSNLNEGKEYLKNNPLRVVTERKEPTYEEIPYDLQKIILESYANGTLFIDTNIPPTKVSFNCFEEELTYLYPSTSYTLQFVSDRNTIADIVLGGASLLSQSIVKGLNRITITTPSELVDNKLIIDGVGANIKEIVVTDTDREFGYFEGMKSVGECEDLEVVSSNSDDTQSNIQTLTHEPLRSVGEIKDKYVLIDGKWYIERNCGEVKLRGTEGYLYINDNSPDCTIIGINLNGKGETVPVKCNTLPYISFGYQKNIKCISSYGDAVNGFAIYIAIPNSELLSSDKKGVQQWLVNNLTTVVYQLASPTYEPINYNLFTLYSDITHISNNSTIPCNMIIKNHGYNMVALKENTSYTLYVDNKNNTSVTYRLGDYVEINSLSKFTFTTPSTLTDKTLRIDGKGNSVKDLMLIEGTPTNDSIGYFDGLKSSYECEKVTDENDENYGKYKVDVKVVGKNLFNAKAITNYSYQINNGITPSCSSNGEVILNGIAENIYDFRVLSGNNIGGNISNNRPLYKYVHSLPNGTSLTLSNDLGFESYWALFRNGKTTYHKDTINIQTGDIVNCFIRIPLGTTLNNQVIHIQIEEGDTATEYEPYFESKQTIYLNSPLLKGDEIVWKDNKIQHYHKMHKVVLDGSDDEKWKRQPELDNDTTERYWIEKINNNQLLDVKINTISYNDKFDNIAKNNTCLYTHPTSARVDLRRLKTDIRWTDLNSLKQWLQANPVTVVYELETPYYEEISDYPLKLNVIANSSLSTESTIQVTNISFNIYEETLSYLYPNTKYYITFNADVDRNNIIIDLGGNHVVFDCKVGFNKVEITTPSDTTNLLTFSGTGVNIDHVKVTQQDIDEYFEGMKSVGECEELEVTSANSDNTLSNSQQLTHEPLRAVGDVKDKYVLLDGKWHIERNTYKYKITKDTKFFIQSDSLENYDILAINTSDFPLHPTNKKPLCDKFLTQPANWNNLHHEEIECVQTYDNDRIFIKVLSSRLPKVYDNAMDNFKEWLTNNEFNIIYPVASPTYEPIGYNPFEVYSDITHITTNSLIPTNVVVKNHGYNCILKPSTKYTIALNKPNGTISAKIGGSAKVDSTNSIFTITTPSTLNDNVLRLSGSGKVKDIMILEGDKTINTPSYFEGIESGFEQEYDVEKGKYRVTAKVEGNGKESSIIFYINEPLRGTGTAKDRAFIQDGKVVVQRNCGSVTLDDSESSWNKANEGYDSVNNITFSILMDNLLSAWLTPNNILCSTLPSVGHYVWGGTAEGVTSDTEKILLCISRRKLKTQDLNGFKQWLQQNPTTVVYTLLEPVYEEADCDLSKLVLENYEDSSLIFKSNIPVSANIRYSGEVPVVTQAKSLSSQVDNTTLDINENIIPYMCDIDYRIVELQLMNGDTQGEGIELLGIGDIEILGNENVLFNNREDKKYNYSYDMLKRDILSKRYSREEYQYRLDRYLLANKISDEEYKELEGLLNNGE